MAKGRQSDIFKFGVRFSYLLGWAVLYLIILTEVLKAETVYEGLGHRSDLYKFREMVNRDEVLRKTLQHWTVTVFAPTDEAVIRSEEWVVGRENKVVAYHILHLLANQSLFPYAAPTSLAGAPPVFLGVKEMSRPRKIKQYFANNAKITETKEFVSLGGELQILYVIDEILRPYLYSSNLPPNTFQLLEKPELYDIREPLSAFFSRVKQEKCEKLFQREGNHTFFIPVGAGLGHSFNRQQEVDKWVIRGHVIPKNVIFTRLTLSESYKSEAYDDDIKVELSIVNESSTDGDSNNLYAQSNTMHSDHGHKKGVVMSKILKPNIPVKNGVVHLIEKPLMIIDITVWKFIEKETRLSEFLNLVNYAPDFKDLLMSPEEKTLFAPSNEAIKKHSRDTVEAVKKNITGITSLLRLHLAMKSISTDDVLYGRCREYKSADNRNTLYFRILGNEHNKTLTVDGGGVTAAAVQSDIGAVDGMVHIVDRLLGMPYKTMFRKLQSDPDLRITYELSEQDDWASKLDNQDQRFTFFVPSNEAWLDLQMQMPTEYKELIQGLYPYHVRKILSRHLVVGKELDSVALNRTDEIQMLHGHFRIKPAPGFDGSRFHYGDKILEWEGVEARIVRQDVQAINGIIHVIDRVMMKRRDLTKSSAATPRSKVFLLLVVLIFGFFV